MILGKMSQNFMERKIRGGKKRRLAVFTRRIEQIDQTRIILDEFVQDFMMRRVCEEFIDRGIDILEMRVRALAMARPVWPVGTFRWMWAFRWVRTFGEFGTIREFGTVGKFWSVREFWWMRDSGG